MTSKRLRDARAHWEYLRGICDDDRALVQRMLVDAVAGGAPRSEATRLAAPLLRRIHHREKSLRRLVFRYGYGHSDALPVHVPARWDEVQELADALQSLPEVHRA